MKNAVGGNAGAAFIPKDNGQVAAALKQVLSLPDEELFQKGCQAREFVLRERNNVVQAAKVLEMLEGKQ